MSTPVTNFGKGTVSTTYGAADVSIALTAGHGSRFPSTFPYPLTWWNSTDYSDPADDPNREIVTVTNRSGDTLTVTRGAESTGASTKNTAGKTYKMLLGITKAMWEGLGDRTLSQAFRGLTLSSHYDSDLDNYQTIFSADAIVMSDGEEVSDWNNIVTDITASGAGGLDTGTEQNSTWYEQYAIYNGTTKAGCLHRAKDWFLDLDITANEDATQGIRSAVDNSTVRVSQGITPVTAGEVPFIDVKLIKVGSPTGNIWFTIEANNGGVPSNTPLATSWKADISLIPTTATTIRFPFTVPASLSASTVYHVVAYGDWTVSATNYIGWRMDGSAAAYAGGSKALYDSDTATWTADTDDDMTLQVYVERNNVAFSTTVPSGYRYAKIGYVRNDSGGDFDKFIQWNNSWQRKDVFLDGLAVNETSSTPKLYDLRSFVPPLKTQIVRLALTGTGAASAAMAIADITTTNPATGSVGQAYLFAGTTAEDPVGRGPVTIYYAAIMGDATSGADLYVEGFMW